MSEKDAYDRAIDEALRVVGGGEPPTGYLDRLQCRIAAAPETHTRSGSIRRWIPAAALASAVLVAALLPMLRHRSEPAKIAKVSAKNSENQRTAHAGARSSRTEIYVPAASRTRHQHAKHRRVIARDAANLFNYPLTNQEKLLVQFARTAPPDELKELNPEYEAKVEAQQEAEFAAYVKSGDDPGSNPDDSGAKQTNSTVQTTQE